MEPEGSTTGSGSGHPALPLAQVSGSAALLGSPSFMPPEQINPRFGKLGAHSDVYALGGILYYALCGQPPFVAASIDETLLKVVDLAPIPPRTVRRSVPRDLETLCLKCLEKHPAQRFASAEELQRELRRYLDDEPIQSRPLGLGARGGRWIRKRPVVAGIDGGMARWEATTGLGMTVATTQNLSLPIGWAVDGSWVA